MDPITIILTALAAGASAGVGEQLRVDAREAVSAAYGKLRGLVKNRFNGSGTANAEAVLDEYEGDPETYETPLKKKLTDAGAHDDNEIVAAASALLELLQQNQPAATSKYAVTISDSKGVQVGDGNTQTNTFNW